MHAPDAMEKAVRPVLTASHYGLLTLGYLALVLYGSLVPFRFQGLPFEEAVDLFRGLPYFTLGIESRSDWVANLLLFIPLAFLTMGALCVDRRGGTILAAAVVLPAAVALSLAIEFVQLYFPPRTTSLNDVVAESLGGLLGVLVWAIGGQRLTGWVRRLWAVGRTSGLAAQLLPAYLLILVLVHVMPLDLTISPVEVYHKYREGRVRLVPFSGWDGSALTAFSKVLWTTVYFVPGGLLVAYLPRFARARWPQVLLLGLLLAGFVEFLQLFVFTRYVDTTDILIGGLAVLGGWLAGRAWQATKDKETRRHGDTETRRHGDTEQEGLPGLRIAALLCWLGVVVLISWWPFHFLVDPESVAARWAGVSFVPFADYYAGTDYNAYDQFLHKTLLFLPLGALLAPASGRLRAVGGVLLVAAMVSVALEAGQLFLSDRCPSLTDVLVQSLGAGLGFLMAQRVRLMLRSAEVVGEKNRELCR